MIVFVGAVAVAVLLIRPLRAGPISFDSASSVIHFQRILSGAHLEGFITTTPKPLLTVVFGALHLVFGDWRAISWATIGAYGLAIALATALATRLEGLAAGAFVAVGLVASRPVFAEVAIATAVPWAMVGWAAAGLAVTAPRPRYALAGIALCLAGLARLETLIVVAAALGLLMIGWLRHRLRGGPALPRGAWWVLLGALALPVMLLHDWLLTGDPFFWASVPLRASAQAPLAVLTPAQLFHLFVIRYRPLIAFELLAVAGVVALAQRRNVAIAAGLLALGPGVAAFLFSLSARGIYVSDRYLVSIDVALLFTAGLGAGFLAQAILARMPVHRPSVRWGAIAGAAALAGLLALGAGWPPAPLDPATQTEARRQLRQAIDELQVLPVLGAALDATPGSRDVIASGSGPGARSVLVPVLLRSRMAVDLRLPLTRVGSTGASGLSPHPWFLPGVWLIYHDRSANETAPEFGLLEPIETTAVDGVALAPLLADPATGIWVLRLDRP